MPFDSINKTLICRLSKQPTPAKNVFATTSILSDIALSKIVTYQQQKGREQLIKSENTIRRDKSTIEKTALSTAFTLSTGQILFIQICSSYISVEFSSFYCAYRSLRFYLARYPAFLRFSSSSFTVLITSVSVAVEARSFTCSAAAGAGPVAPVVPCAPASPAGP